MQFMKFQQENKLFSIFSKQIYHRFPLNSEYPLKDHLKSLIPLISSFLLYLSHLSATGTKFFVVFRSSTKEKIEKFYYALGEGSTVQNLVCLRFLQ